MFWCVAFPAHLVLLQEFDLNQILSLNVDLFLGPRTALFLGWAAQITNIFNPLLGLIALNMTAAVYALEVFRDGQDGPDFKQ